MFTDRLATLAAAAGVTFRFKTAISAIVTEAGRIGRVETGDGPLTADAYVVALGSYSRGLLRPSALRIPVYPIKGYSITLPIVDAAAAPVSTVMDESYKVAITRLGDRIRVGGTAEVSGYDLSLHPARRATLDQSVTDLFPHGGDLARSTLLVRAAADDAGRNAASSAGRGSPTSTSTPGTARWAGRWPAAPAASSPTSSQGGSPTSRSATSGWIVAPRSRRRRSWRAADADSSGKLPIGESSARSGTVPRSGGLWASRN